MFSGYRKTGRSGMARLAALTALPPFRLLPSRVLPLASLPLVLLSMAAPLGAHETKGDSAPALHERIDDLLQEHGLDSENMALMVFSTRKRRFLYRLRERVPMIAASNAKLATTYAALRVLGSNHRWKTIFYLVPEQIGPAGAVRQGLLVKGGGDPTITSGTMEKIALQLKTRGLHRVAGGLYFDASLYDKVMYPAAWGSAIGDQAWFAPVSPFIVEKNAASFFVSVSRNGKGVEVIPQFPFDIFGVNSRLRTSPVERALIRVNQSWRGDRGVFSFRGHVPRKPHVYTVSTAIRNPEAFFFHFLRRSLRKLGVRGRMPRRPMPRRDFPRERIYTHFSPPLRELLVDVNKESNNLAAEVVLRTLALTKRAAGASGAQGLRVLQQTLREDFPRFAGQVQMADGSGLSRETRLSASFLVHLLNRVLARHEFRAEYLSSLSLGGWDGTLRYRNYPERFRGRIRAKSGTLSGVQNLSGYLHLGKDIVVFSFLINDSSRHFASLQAAQDAVLTGIFDHLLQAELR